MIDFGMDPAEAVGAPRMHHQWVPEKLFLDVGISPDTSTARSNFGIPQTIRIELFYFLSI
jgi:gamma-glutamyltranspeptidase/glutathione hydrolase